MSATLWLHIGLNKTGSSFLQSSLFECWEALEASGFYWPSSSWDAAMVQGEISPGNGFPLATALAAGDAEGCNRLCSEWFHQARDVGCSGVVASSESLAHHLVVGERLSMLCASARRAGFQQIRLLAFVRDLADHAMSTYKHRAKQGRIVDPVAWVRQHYETPGLLQEMLARIEEDWPVDWSIRVYDRDSRHLLDATLADWLGLDVPGDVQRRSVNASLTLSEIELMIHTRPQFARVMDLFVSRLKSLPMSEKARDGDLERWTYAALRQPLDAYRDVVDGVSRHMPGDERLQLGREPEEEFLGARRPPAVLSSSQLRTYAETIGYLTSSRGRALRLRRRAVDALPDPVARSVLALTRLGSHEVHR